jgi:hypothetical protein
MRVKSRGRGRNLKRFAAIVTSMFVAIGAIFLAWMQPAIAALACPMCFGMERLSGNVFVENAMSEPERMHLLAIMAKGEKMVADFYGELHENPVVLACATEACSRRLGGRGAKAISYANIGIRLSPSGFDPTIVAHERAHIELHGRLGFVRFLSGAVPAWFDEGLAVVISDDSRYLLPADAKNRCRAEPAENLPSGMTEWNQRASADHLLYAEAACRVLRWGDARGGRRALLALIARVAQGERFDIVYGG